MPTTKVRKVVHIDEEKCNGCGDCVPSCAEGAIKIINGKARLVADNLCDGLGACLGHCPMDAITIEERAADDFDEHAVEQHLNQQARPQQPAFTMMPPPRPAIQPSHAHGHGGCPGSRMRFEAPAPAAARPATAATGQSSLRQWPVQLALLPVQAALWQDANILLAADCVPFAYPDFHNTLLPGKSLAIACPKLDNCEPYVEKLAAILASNNVRSISVAYMEVPCCYGLVRVAELAIQRSGRTDLQLERITLSIRGEMK